jgi:hypothetical protein
LSRFEATTPAVYMTAEPERNEQRLADWLWTPPKLLAVLELALDLLEEGEAA